MDAGEFRKTKDVETSDNDLVHQALSGDQQAFEALVSRYQRTLLRLIYQYIGEYHEAQDVLQQVWLQLFLSLPSLEPHVHMKPWLFTVARNRSVDVLRRRRALFFSELETVNDEEETAYLDTIPDTSPKPEEEIEQRDLQREIQRAIQTLPCIHRAVVSLYYSEQMSYSEIGQILMMPVSTVKARFHRAKPLLRATITSQ